MSPSLVLDARVGVVVIGRNEGERLKACLRSIPPGSDVVYVDSGSTDGSQDFARGIGVEVVDLRVPPAFTAARARNAGVRALTARALKPDFIQMIDGDCVLDPDWMAAASEALTRDKTLAGVVGRLRERFPETSIYNAQCDDEWNGTPGETATIGGIAMLRLEALAAVGGYPENMIAGEEPEMALRMRHAGWRLLRMSDEMALHDAAITRFGQWWRRAVRAGHAFAELAFRHPDTRLPDWSRKCRSILLWGLIGPLALLGTLLLAFVAKGLWAVMSLIILIAYPAQALRVASMKRKRGIGWNLALAFGVLTMIAKFAETTGLFRFHRNRLARHQSALIEYKG